MGGRTAAGKTGAVRRYRACSQRRGHAGPALFFLQLGGFEEDYIGDCFYEAYDFCFRAWVAEGAVMVDPRLTFYDLQTPAQSGDALAIGTMAINRALFNDRWGDVLDLLADTGEILPTAVAPAIRAGLPEAANIGPLELP